MSIGFLGAIENANGMDFEDALRQMGEISPNLARDQQAEQTALDLAVTEWILSVNDEEHDTE